MKHYVTFTASGIHVDVARYLKTPQGKEALRKIDEASKRFERKCPDCGSPQRNEKLK